MNSFCNKLSYCIPFIDFKTKDVGKRTRYERKYVVACKKAQNKDHNKLYCQLLCFVKENQINIVEMPP